MASVKGAICAICMQQSSLGIRLGFARYTAKGSLSAQGNERQQHPRAIARASAAKQREIDLARSEKRKLSIPRLAVLSPQAGARGGRRFPSLVPGCLKVLKYLFPRAVRAAQCHPSNELNRFGGAAQNNRRAGADTQLWIDWKVRHDALTLSHGPSSIGPKVA